MYSSCIFCRSALGANEIIAAFPVGRRLAFDAAKGRLWVVCARCNRWNLTPLEARWEAIEECEQSFRAARTRVSTDNIALARVAQGFELVRIGKAPPPEYAAWRYGPTLRRRRAEMTALVAASVAVGTGIAFGGMQTGVIAAGALQAGVYLAHIGAMVRHHRAVVARIPAPDGSTLRVRAQDLRHARIQAAPSGWRLLVRHAGGSVPMAGKSAEQAARHLLPWMNRRGGSARDVQSAVSAVEQAGGPRRFWTALLAGERRNGGVAIEQLETPVRLALEIAANEEVERLALDGELALLEREWRESDELADIADNLP